MKQKHDGALVVRTQLNDELKIEFSADLYRKIAELHEFSELSLYERDDAKQKHEADIVVKNDELKLELVATVDRKENLR